MGESYKIIEVRTACHTELVDITSQINGLIADSGISEGICCLYVPHTTAALLINENADPDVVQDITSKLERIVPWKENYLHLEGNSAAHIKASLFQTSQVILVEGGKLLLGIWQGVFFCEFDGPRQREVFIKIIPS
ncbi:MAG: secondary thiamine-phosphate synthase enzyme YjbQ [Eubacteriales bacterium]|jgi:secondary thiamine-phosphate synthase enzyme